MHSFASASEAAARGNHRIAAAALVVLVTAGLCAVAWPRLSQLGDRVRVVPANDPTVGLDREITAEFGMQNPIVWVIVARQGTVWTRPVLSHVHAITREALIIPGVIATDVLSLASPSVRDVEVTEDSLEPMYLMAEVPETSDAVARLRQRVEGNPNYNGVLVSLDGRAAMVIANFRSDADEEAAGAAALAVRERHRDADTEIYVSGRPVMGATVLPAVPEMAVVAGLIAAAAAVVLVVSAGAWATLSATIAMALAGLWSVGVLASIGAVVLPWTAFGILPALLLAAACAIAGHRAGRLQVVAVASLALAGAVLSFLGGEPAGALGTAAATGMVAALLAAMVARWLVGGEVRPVRDWRWRRRVALALVATAVPGLAWFQVSYGAFGYGERYLPAEGAANLRGLAEHFPPPTALAVRFRGEPGFVTSPAVMQAFDAVTKVARADPAGVRAMSLADLVKIVHRTFNGNRPEFFTIPNEAALIGRYLALSYSPGFRTFVDRAFSRAAIWVYLSGDDPSDLERVRGAIVAQLAAQPVPGAEVDLMGGDGAVVLVMARTARRLALAAVAGLIGALVIAGALGGWRAAVRAFAGGVIASAVATGMLGWLGLPIDLVSLSCVVAAALAGGAMSVLSAKEVFPYAGALLLAIGALTVILLIVPYAGAQVLGASLLGVVLAPAVCARGP